MSSQSARDVDDEYGRVFNVHAFTRSAHGNMRETIAFDHFQAEPLSEDVVRALRILAVLEGATMAHLRNVLVTATHKDARVTAFLVTWAFEKFWIADALVAIADASAEGRSGGRESAPGGAKDADEVIAPARIRGRGPVRRATSGFIAGRSIVGAHMVAGLIDDLVLDVTYQTVAERAADPVLSATVATIRETKAQHTAFFREESLALLRADPKSGRLADRDIRHESWPIGVPLLDAADRRAFTEFVFSGAAGRERATVIADALGALPGVHSETIDSLTERLTTEGSR